MEGHQGAFLRITEQPAHNKQRFRYSCEGRRPEIIYGQNSTKKKRTYPSVEIVGYRGPAVILVSCVEDSFPFRAHPNIIINRNVASEGGFIHQDVNISNMSCCFKNIGIQCVKRNDIPMSLEQRKASEVDPFKQGFNHAESLFNPYVLRICFQAFLKKGNTLVTLQPIVSDIIADNRKHPIPQIHDLSDNWSFFEGGKKIILLTNKVYKEDVEIHFTDNEDASKSSWNAMGRSVIIHKQHSICFYTPPYDPGQTELTHPVKVYMNLYRPTLQHKSEYLEFLYFPGSSLMKRKYKSDKSSTKNDLSSKRVLPPPKVVHEVKTESFNINKVSETNQMISKESLNLSDIVDLELSRLVNSDLSLQLEDAPEFSSRNKNPSPGGFHSIDDVFQFLSET